MIFQKRRGFLRNFALINKQNSINEIKSKKEGVDDLYIALYNLFFASSSFVLFISYFRLVLLLLVLLL